MGFKENWSFLDKLSMGAVGTTKVREVLNRNGHNLIELERHSLNNKIWPTKIKRLRVPDLVCLNCGKRIESRAKSNLGIIMSDSPCVKERKWDYGLRNDDLVAFIFCSKDGSGSWVASDEVNLFTVQDLRNSEENTKLGAPKSANEGAERDRSWSSYTPGFNGSVYSITDTHIKFIKEDGGSYNKKIAEDHYVHVQVGEHLVSNSKIVHSIVENKEHGRCESINYNFLNDLNGHDLETQYCAVKALGYSSENRHLTVTALRQLSERSSDMRIKLEILSSLAKLGEDVWSQLTGVLSTAEIKLKMELVFILGELIDLTPAQEMLKGIVNNEALNNEIRAAAIWVMGNQELLFDFILSKTSDLDTLVATHAYTAIERVIKPKHTALLLQLLDGNTRNRDSAIRLISTSCNLDDNLIVHRLISEPDKAKKKSLLYAIGTSDRNRFQYKIQTIDPDAENTLSLLSVFWQNSNSWITKEIENEIEFLKKQK
ncbi:MAG: hypothetical protein KGZ45_07385 [Clostridium sp.]|nr:hypothetical protein [Clostridium sp.]